MFQIFIFCITINVISATIPSAVTYQKNGCNGAAIDMSAENGNTYDTNLGRSVHAIGAWLFYNKKYYAGSTRYVYAANHTCITLPEDFGSIKSARLVGNETDFYAEGIALYENLNFQNPQVTDKSNYFVTTEVPRLAGRGNNIPSYIIVGNSSWTLYGGERFQGDSICVHPTEDGSEPTLVTDTLIHDPPIDRDFAYSVRKGCEGI